jgi:hypothetical protein
MENPLLFIKGRSPRIPAAEPFSGQKRLLVMMEWFSRSLGEFMNDD